MSAVGVQWHALASVVYTAGVPSFLFQSGKFAAAIVDTGAGDMTVNLLAAEGVDATECIMMAQVRGANPGYANVVHTSDTAKQILVFDDAGAAADLDVDIFIARRQFV